MLWLLARNEVKILSSVEMYGGCNFYLKESVNLKFYLKVDQKKNYEYMSHENTFLEFIVEDYFRKIRLLSHL